MIVWVLFYFPICSAYLAGVPPDAPEASNPARGLRLTSALMRFRGEIHFTFSSDLRARRSGTKQAGLQEVPDGQVGERVTGAMVASLTSAGCAGCSTLPRLVVTSLVSAQPPQEECWKTQLRGA